MALLGLSQGPLGAAKARGPAGLKPFWGCSCWSGSEHGVLCLGSPCGDCTRWFSSDHGLRGASTGWQGSRSCAAPGTGSGRWQLHVGVSSGWVAASSWLGRQLLGGFWLVAKEGRGRRGGGGGEGKALEILMSLVKLYLGSGSRSSGLVEVRGIVAQP